MSDTTTKPFAAWLQEQRDGDAHDEASALLQELISACVETGKSGVLTLTVKVKPSMAGGRTVFVTDEIKAKIPEADREVAVFYVDKDGNLHRNDPDQGKFDGMSVVKGAEARA